MSGHNHNHGEGRLLALATRLDGETRCPCCGVGMKSGKQYPECSTDANGHAFCRNWDDDACAACTEMLTRGVSL